MYTEGVSPSAELEITTAAREFLQGGEGVEANLQSFVDDCDRVSSFYYSHFGDIWLDGIVKTERHIFQIAWAAMMLNFCLAEGDFCWTREELEPAIKAAARALDFAEVVWNLDCYAGSGLPFSCPSRTLRDDFAEACIRMEVEQAERDLRLAALPFIRRSAH